MVAAASLISVIRYRRLSLISWTSYRPSSGRPGEVLFGGVLLPCRSWLRWISVVCPECLVAEEGAFLPLDYGVVPSERSNIGDPRYLFAVICVVLTQDVAGTDHVVAFRKG